LPGDYRIVAAPSLRVVSPGAKITYRLEPTRKEAAAVDTLACSWFCINDPKSVAFSRPSRVGGASGPEWPDAEWQFVGRHRIVCRVSGQGAATDYGYDQEVAPLETVLIAGPTLPLETQDPEGALDGATRLVALVHAVAKASPPAKSQAEQHEKEMRQLEEYSDRLDKRLRATRGVRRYPVRARHFSVEAQKWTTLNVFAAKVNGKWWIVDWTNVAVRALTGEYGGSGESNEAAIKAALDDWDENNRYPNGKLEYELSRVPGVPTISGSFDTDGSAFWDSVSSFLTWVGLGAAAAAAAIMFLSPVPGPQAASVLIWSSIFSSTAAATINISRRADEGFSSWQANTFDVLAIVGNMFGAAGLVWSRGAQVTAKFGPGMLNAVLVGQVGTDSVQGVLIAADHIEEFERIRADTSLTPKQKTDRMLELCRSLAVNGLLIYVNVKATKADLDNLKMAPKHVKGEAPAETLARLGNPEEKLDLTRDRVVVEGHTAGGEHETTVQLDENSAAPQAGGRGHPVAPRSPNKQPPKGPQKLADLDALYVQAAGAQEQLSALTRGIASELGGEAMVPPTLKGRARAQEKIVADYGGDASQIVDLARSSIVFKTMNQVKAAIAAVTSRAKVTRVKDRFDKPVNGYRDVLFNLEMPNGHVVEMQLHLEGIMSIKNGEGHAIYEQARAIEAELTSAKRPPTADEVARITALNARMKNLYDDAFRKAGGKN
jgi:hypothetical protein